ncbi:MAG TPA: glycosyltransferase family 39 protein, partial [Longimicrobiales bacterium]|nr:glycosyltransferase family 39 protein [Longimicrobiales bacterium]
MSVERTRRPLLLVASVTVGLVLVAGAFDPSPHTGGDNAGYVSLAHGLLTTGSYVETFDPAQAPHTKYPPVFPLALAALMALGARTWVVLKLVAAVSTLAVVGLTYLWAERRVGALPAFLLAVLIAASTGFVYYSHWVLSDALFVALAMAALWALERGEPVAEAPPRGASAREAAAREVPA